MSDSCSEISVKDRALPSIKNPAKNTRKMVEDQLARAGRWNRFKDKSTGRKYLLMLARWHEWWNSDEVIAIRRRPLTDARISERLLSAFCEANVTKDSCGQFKAAMMILHAEALKQGGITPECRFWKDLKKDKVCSWVSENKGAKSSRWASTLQETEHFWKLTKPFHFPGWLMLRVCYEGCLRREDLDVISWGSIRKNLKGLWESEPWTQGKNKVEKTILLKWETYEMIKQYRKDEKLD